MNTYNYTYIYIYIYVQGTPEDRRVYLLHDLPNLIATTRTVNLQRTLPASNSLSVRTVFKWDFGHICRSVQKLWPGPMCWIQDVRFTTKWPASIWLILVVIHA